MSRPLHGRVCPARTPSPPTRGARLLPGSPLPGLGGASGRMGCADRLPSARPETSPCALPARPLLHHPTPSALALAGSPLQLAAASARPSRIPVAATFGRARVGWPPQQPPWLRITLAAPANPCPCWCTLRLLHCDAAARPRLHHGAPLFPNAAVCALHLTRSACLGEPVLAAPSPSCISRAPRQCRAPVAPRTDFCECPWFTLIQTKELQQSRSLNRARGGGWLPCRVRPTPLLSTMLFANMGVTLAPRPLLTAPTARRSLCCDATHGACDCTSSHPLAALRRNCPALLLSCTFVTTESLPYSCPPPLNPVARPPAARSGRGHAAPAWLASSAPPP